MVMWTTYILIWWLLSNISVVEIKIVSVAREEAANYRSTYGSPIPLKVADVTPFMFLSFWLVYLHQCFVFPNITINIAPLLTMAYPTFM